MDDRQQLERAIAAQEQLRGIVDDEIVDVTVASLRARLDGLAPSNQRRVSGVKTASGSIRPAYRATPA